MAESKKILNIKIRKWNRKKILKSILLLTLLGTAVLFGAVVGTYVAVRKTLPDLSGLETYAPALSTSILAADGKVIREIGSEKRVVIPYDRIPDVLKNAILATEDPRFFKHHGIDVRGILRSIKENAFNIFRRVKLHGGSTIT